MSRKTQSSQNIDKIIGRRIRHFRLKREMSQHDLARILEISYQQLHKYETGSNSVSASRLSDIARAMSIREADLFYELEQTGAQSTDNASEHKPSLGHEQMLLVNYLERIREPEKRQVLSELLISLSTSDA